MNIADLWAKFLGFIASEAPEILADAQEVINVLTKLINMISTPTVTGDDTTGA